MTVPISLAQWMLRLTLAEALGIAVVASTYGALDRGLIGPDAPFVLAAGAWEGLCLGLAQASLLVRRGASLPLWTGLTILGAVAGYALSLPVAAGADPGAADPPFWLILLAGAGLGLGMGVLMGLVQSPALPSDLPRRRWVIANALGWIPAMSVIIAGAASVPADWPLGLIALTGAVSGALAGAAVALVTGLALRPR